MRSRSRLPTCVDLGSFWRTRSRLLPRPGDATLPEKKMQAAPRRLQLRRSKGWRMPANTVKVDRSTLFGNPFLAVDYGSNGAVALFRAWITGRCANVACRRRRSERWRGDEPISLAPCPPCVARTSRAGVHCRAGANRTHAMPRSCWNWPTGDCHRRRAPQSTSRIRRCECARREAWAAAAFLRAGKSCRRKPGAPQPR